MKKKNEIEPLTSYELIDWWEVNALVAENNGDSHIAAYCRRQIDVIKLNEKDTNAY